MESGTSEKVAGSMTRAPLVAGVKKMSKILMMFGWSRRFRTTTSRKTRFAASTVVSASATRLSATNREDRASKDLTTAPKLPQPSTETSR